MDWRQWCRACGNHDSIAKIEPEIEELASKLNIVNPNLRICVDCNAYLDEMHQFVSRARLIDTMFLEIEQIEMLEHPAQEVSELETENSKLQEAVSPQQDADCVQEYEQTINSIRKKFGLATLETPAEALKNLLVETNLAGALEIKLESELVDFEVQDAVSGYSESEEDEEEEDDSEIEQLSDSQLRKHDQLMQSNEQSSESDQEVQSVQVKRKKKYRKSNDEKMFDFVCHICSEEFQKMCFLSKHCRRVHNCLPQVNCFCGKQLGTWKRLLIHKQLHFPEKLDYECKECKLVYKLKTSYESHIKSKHGPDAKKFVCSQCARCFKDARTLVAHEKTHLPDYLKLTHPCDICNKKFVNKNSLKSHVTSVHEMANLYTCETCGKGFSTKSNLKSHLYVHSNKKDVQCDTCSARFKNMDSLRKHKKTHLEKSHVCTICGNRYRNRNNLKAHLVCHSDIKAYQCTFCPNSYKRSKDLKCHLYLHSGERPYQCQFCARTFVNGSNCRKHKLKDHPEELAAFEAVHGRGKTAVQALQTSHS